MRGETAFLNLRVIAQTEILLTVKGGTLFVGIHQDHSRQIAIYGQLIKYLSISHPDVIARIQTPVFNYSWEFRLRWYITNTSRRTIMIHSNVLTEL